MQASRPSGAQAPAFQFSLHVRHPSIDPGEISRELQLQALESFKAGQPRSSRSGVAATAVHGETYWVAVIDPAHWPGPPSVPGHEEHAALASLTPHEAKVLRARFGLDVAAAGGIRDIGAALALVCESLVVRHGVFLNQLRTQGGSVTLQVTLSSQAQGGFRLTPELGLWLVKLGITLEFEFAGEVP